MTNINVLGIDIAKHVFQLHGVDKQGKLVYKKRLSRKKLAEEIQNVSPCTIVMEACGGASYWSRKFKKMGHKVKLISPQFVKPFVKSSKNDANDAEAIVEAASRPSMRFVSPKTVEQQDIQSLHRVRERLISQKTALSNQIRGLLAEYGLVCAQGYASLRKGIQDFLEDAENELTFRMRELLSDLYDELLAIEKKVKAYDKRIDVVFKANADCQRIAKIEGIGPIIATIIVSDMGDPKQFKNGREYAAYLGLTPRQHSSGSKDKLLGITKRGDQYIRKQLIHGTRSVVYRAGSKSDKKSCWLQALKIRRGINRTCVALANKNARVIWALLANQSDYVPASA